MNWSCRICLLIVRDRSVRVWSSAGVVGRDERRDVEGHATELKPKPPAQDGQDRIFSPRVSVEHSFRLVMAVGQPNAAGVEVKLRAGADAAHKLHMRVAAA